MHVTLIPCRVLQVQYMHVHVCTCVAEVLIMDGICTCTCIIYVYRSCKSYTCITYVTVHKVLCTAGRLHTVSFRISKDCTYSLIEEFSRSYCATSARMVHVHVHAGHVSYKVYTCNTNIADQIKFKTAR